nr:carboxypeptidase Q-like [Dermacentor andersoni]XP_054923258.1 carboxypeptidase Q-like [Dermacentor andersoni]
MLTTSTQASLLRLLTALATILASEHVYCREGENVSCTDEVISRHLIDEIQGYAPIVQSIINAVVYGSERNKTYEELASFVDTFGARFTGSDTLEKSIDYMVKLLKSRNLDKVYTEPVEVPRWIRGTEKAWMTAPRRKRLAILGLGFSGKTACRGLTAEVLVVDSFEELHENRDKARGRIVVFNQKFDTYMGSLMYRTRGPALAAKVGAVAALVRSLTPLSIASPHTGSTTFLPNETSIPAASVAVEDAELLKRLQNRGLTVSVKLVMRNKNLSSVISRNTVADIRGTEKPGEVVIVSGHLDSWDVGQGAMDDGGGAFISWRALDVLHQLGLRSRRTIRAVLWTAEEIGVLGAKEYYRAHGDEKVERINIAMESDTGTFKPTGLGFRGHSDRARCMIAEVLRLFSNINATSLMIRAAAPDLVFWIKAGVPVASLSTENAQYLYFHHTEGDTMTVENPKNLDLCTALWAGVAYVLADLSEDLPRK